MNQKIKEEVSAFLKEYEVASNSHDFNNVRPLILPEAVYYFSNENLYGIREIEKAFTETFNTIKDETYSIKEVEWVGLSDTVAACVYKFHWIGFVGGEQKSGEGRGTNVLIKRDGKWQMAHEHLSMLRNAA